MKKLIITLALGVFAINGTQAATAYEALEVLKKARGQAILKQLVQVRGETGQPQPQSWTILMNDPLARGGIREFVISGGEIASERTPIRDYNTSTNASVLNFSRLNVDSDGVFKIANAQATNAKLGFHVIDYTLRTNDVDGAPMWVLHLFDYMGAPVGNLRVSAEDARIIRALQVDPDVRQKPVGQTPHPTKIKKTPVADATPKSTPVFKGGVFGFVERTSKKVGRSVKKTTLNVAGTVQEVLTGERTIDDDSTDQ